MTVSLSFTIVNTYAPQSAKPATATSVERKTPPVQSDDDAGCGHKRPASRQNRLADAMMSALRELGFGGTAAPAAATAAATPAASATSASTTAAQATSASASADAAAATDPSASVESAVQQFAHALFQALRQGGSSNSKADDGGDERVEGHGHHRHHHHRRHGDGEAYGNMSQRLEALSQTFGAPATAAAASTPAAASTATADAPAATTNATPAPATSTTTVIAAPAAAAAKTPLLDAFTKLFNALKPASTDNAATTTPATDMAEKLRLFLHTLAQSLAPDTMGSVQRAQVGGLVNVTA